MAPSPTRTRRSRQSIAYVPNAGSKSDDATSVFENEVLMGGKRAAKKSRSKSIGPGGLEALREGSGNRQKVLSAVKSILKPTIPLSPLVAIPPLSRKPSPGRKSPSRSPAKERKPAAETSSARDDEVSTPVQDAAQTHPRSSESEKQRVAVRTEEEQQAAARERAKKEAIARRDERRKSLANRRVSFAPEATLHTWDVVELAEDATSSSEATTRRASTGSTLSSFASGPNTIGGCDIADPPSTPPRAVEEDATSPGSQRDLHQKKRGRSSAVHPSNSQEALSSSPISSVGDEDTQQSFATAEGESIEGESEEDEDDRDTYVDDDATIGDNVTANTISSVRTDDTSSTSSSARLDARLRRASDQAGTQGIEYDERGENLDMDQGNQASLTDKENDDIFQDAEEDSEEDMEETMEVTQAIGGIITLPEKLQTSKVSSAPGRRKSQAARRHSSNASSAGDETMDFTEAVGSIQRMVSVAQREGDEHEDMSMEFTAVVGGVLDRPQQDDNDLANQQLIAEAVCGINMQEDETGQMEMTTALGRILSPVTERTEPSFDATETMDMTTSFGGILPKAQPQIQSQRQVEEDEGTMPMDITTAIGAIMPSGLKTDGEMAAKHLMKEEVDHGQLTRSPLLRGTSPAEPSIRDHGQSPVHQQESTPLVATPSSVSRGLTPLRKAVTPAKQLTPRPGGPPTTPSKTPPNKNIAMRKASPRKLFEEHEHTGSGRRSTPTTPTLASVQKKQALDLSKPWTKLTPGSRQSLGGVNGEASIGSPRVAALLDRRTSIGDSAEVFTPQGGTPQFVRFADPKVIEDEVDRERTADMRRESGRGILEDEVNAGEEDKDATINLRDMIQSLTPKKTKLRGRKSLAPGGARGLLGKRPIELDEEDENSPKRRMGPDRSPVKSIKLPGPPSKAETIGRLGKPPRFSLGIASGNVSTPVTEDVPAVKAVTPKGPDQYRDAELNMKHIEMSHSFKDKMVGASPGVQNEIERLHLQDFLNMINVKFMDLDTTKRRHTIAPDEGLNPHQVESSDRQFEACVVAGVSTIPMLELYQHSCRELKKYIAEGRSIVREIETDTFEENPALFREYLSATPDVRAIMDNQFKNVKTHARLLSRAMWYEWRMKLLDGLKDGLLKIADGLVEDAQHLEEQEELLQHIVPALLEEYTQLAMKVDNLQKHAEELASCDQGELDEARQQLISFDGDLEEKRTLLEELQAQTKAQEELHERLRVRKEVCLQETEAAQKAANDCRGWKSSEVAALKAQVDELEAISGWTITSTTGSVLELTYKSSISLFVNPRSFMPACADPSSVSLSFIGNSEPTKEQRFFLQLLRARLHSLDQAQTRLVDILSLVSSGWEYAGWLQSAIDELDMTFMSEAKITGDETMEVVAAIVLRDMMTKVDVTFKMTALGEGTQIKTSIKTTAKVAYGEVLKEATMGSFLTQKIGGDSEFRTWASAVRDLEARLVARGRKGGA